MHKAFQKTRQKKQNFQLENLIALLQKKKEEHKIALPSLKETRFVKTTDIVHCESSNSYTTFYLANNEKLTVSKPILEYEDVLKEYNFIRCHQCYLVNKKFITSWIKTDGDYLLMESGVKIPVSRQRKDHVKEELTNS